MVVGSLWAFAVAGVLPSGLFQEGLLKLASLPADKARPLLLLQLFQAITLLQVRAAGWLCNRFSCLGRVYLRSCSRRFAGAAAQANTPGAAQWPILRGAAQAGQPASRQGTAASAAAAVSGHHIAAGMYQCQSICMLQGFSSSVLEAAGFAGAALQAITLLQVRFRCWAFACFRVCLVVHSKLQVWVMQLLQAITLLRVGILLPLLCVYVCVCLSGCLFRHRHGASSHAAPPPKLMAACLCPV
jgi:hypothetical protein